LHEKSLLAAFDKNMPTDEWPHGHVETVQLVLGGDVVEAHDLAVGLADVLWWERFDASRALEVAASLAGVISSFSSARVFPAVQPTTNDSTIKVLSGWGMSASKRIMNRPFTLARSASEGKRRESR